MLISADIEFAQSRRSSPAFVADGPARAAFASLEASPGVRTHASGSGSSHPVAASGRRIRSSHPVVASGRRIRSSHRVVASGRRIGSSHRVVASASGSGDRHLSIMLAGQPAILIAADIELAHAIRRSTASCRWAAPAADVRRLEFWGLQAHICVGCGSSHLVVAFGRRIWSCIRSSQPRRVVAAASGSGDRHLASASPRAILILADIEHA
jgi:hypothetical protein